MSDKSDGEQPGRKKIKLKKGTPNLEMLEREQRIMSGLCPECGMDLCEHRLTCKDGSFPID